LAEQDIADIAATSDGDTTWGDDMRGAVATLAASRTGTVGRYIVPGPTGFFPLLGGLRGSSVADSFGAATAYYFVFVIPAPVTLSAISVDCITAVGGVNRKYAIFAAGATNTIGAMVTNSSVTIDLGTTGYKTATFGANVALAAGVYWLGMHNSAGSTQVRSFAPTENAHFIVSPGASIDGDSGFWATNGVSYASFPETTPASVTYNQGAEKRR